MLKIQPILGTFSTPGDLKAQVVGDSLMVAEDAYKHIRSTSVIKDADNLVVFLNCYPQIMGAYMGWNIEDVDKSISLLYPLLKGMVADALLNADYDMSQGMGVSEAQGKI